MKSPHSTAPVPVSRASSFALCALALAAMLALTACGGGSDDGDGDQPETIVVPAAPVGLGRVDTAPAPAATIPVGRTDVPSHRIHAAVDGSKRGAVNAGVNVIDAATGYALNNAGYPSGSGDSCYADETTNLSIRPLKGFLEIWQPVTPYMDAYQNPLPESSVTTKEGVTFTCPSIPVTSWSGIPGDGTDGVVLNAALHQANLEYSGRVTAAAYRTEDKALAAYLDDVRGKNYSVSTGLGPLAAPWHALAKQQSYVDTIPSSGSCPDGSDGRYPFCSAPDDEKYNVGEGASHNMADSAAHNPEFGLVTNFMLRVTNDGTASTNPGKYFYKYARPYRWYDAGLSPVAITVSPGLENARKIPSNSSANDIRKDSDFPSGHTAEGVRGAYAYAYLVPQRFQHMLARGLELGDNRIVAGMHSALAVIGGRINGEIASLNLINRVPQQEREAAYAQAQQHLRAAVAAANGGNASLMTDAGFLAYAQSNAGSGDAGPFETPYASHAENKAEYRRRLTFGFTQDMSKAGRPAVVPEGAEVLLETRLPYLSAEQRRVVLKTTALDSGWPVLDDEEGFGRLNFFDAADGYGAFDGDVTVQMDASLGGFHASDTWRNDITGVGKLTKLGSGTLALAGNNRFSGGLIVSEGVLQAADADALGAGMVFLNESGTLRLDAEGAAVKVNTDYVQTGQSTLEVVQRSGQEPALLVNGKAVLDEGSTLRVHFPATVRAGQSVRILSAATVHGKFGKIELPAGIEATVAYDATGVSMNIK
ncbi:phosphatase PAP2 family protein [Lampropedia puyangensis]|uniref:Phosphatase PAP2 family protein n=1 Tax=Lampropedia puyangensis TaxID=1330072 RepID=A0A4V4GR45_9BURK|nr:autotransporter-associated beta strand repeat-containing protein [Lampropedia puyangensis]THU00266.1 phosphatase PAP2 family protein [Lampropedia puyangensis]